MSKTEDTLLELLQQSVAQNAELIRRLDAVPAAPAKLSSPDVETMTNGRAAPRDLHPEENVAFCKSDLGIEVDGVLHCATWTANLQKGRVYRLDDYTVPSGTDKSVEEGGICPLRPTDIRHPKTGVLVQRFLTWQWQTFGLADRQRFVGKPLPAHIRRAAEELALDSATRPSEVAAE